MGIRDKPTAPASPWQNGFAERLIGSIRRECVDHFVVLGEAHLRRIAQLPTFRAAYAKRRCIVPVDGFFEWRAVKGARVKQPFAIAMKDRTPFALGGLWENWRDPQSGEWIHTVAIITVPSNELVAQIHDRMPLILSKGTYERWLGQEPDPHDLLVPFPAEQMAMWPVSTRVNSPDNDDASLLDPAA